MQPPGHEPPPGPHWQPATPGRSGPEPLAPGPMRPGPIRPDAGSTGGRGSGGEARPSSARRVVGWVGFGLALILLVVQYAIPSLTAVMHSFSELNFDGSVQGSAGMQNWTTIAPELAASVGRLLVISVPVLVVAAGLGALVASAVRGVGFVAIAGRVLVALLGVLYLPLAVGLDADLLSAFNPADLGGVILLTLIAALPALTALLATIFSFVESGYGALIVGAVVVGAAVAAGLQWFDLPYVTSSADTRTPIIDLYIQGFQYQELGRAAVVAVVILLLCGIAGIGAMLALILSKARIVIAANADPAPKNTEPARPADLTSTPRRPGGAMAIAGLIVGGAVVLIGVICVGFVLSKEQAWEIVRWQGALLGWLQTTVGVVVQLLVGAVGGIAIGWCRPAGRHSRWLLLPFAPWLFVGAAPFMIQEWLSAYSTGQFGQTMILPPVLLVVAVQVVVALVCFGLPEAASRPLVPLLALSVLTAAGLWLFRSQSLLPWLIVSYNTQESSSSLQAFSIGSSRGDGSLAALLYPLPLILLLALIMVAGQLGIRPLRLRTGDRSST